MNEENAISQLTLTRDISQARDAQLAAINQAVLRMNCRHSSVECRTVTAAAVFLAFLGARIETLIAAEIRNGFREMDGLKNLPDLAQWEYRTAQTLGVAEGLNRVGIIQAKIIEQAQASLHKASFLLMTQSGKTDLPVTKKSQQDYIQSIVTDLNPKQGKRMGSVNSMAVQLSKNFLQRASKAQNDLEPTITSTCAAAIDLTIATFVTKISGFASEAVKFGIYSNDPTRSALDPEVRMARLIASSIVSVCVVDLLKENAPWESVNYN